MKSQTRLSVRSINQSNRSISVRLSFLFCSRAFISRSYENRSTSLESTEELITATAVCWIGRPGRGVLNQGVLLLGHSSSSSSWKTNFEPDFLFCSEGRGVGCLLKNGWLPCVLNTWVSPSLDTHITVSSSLRHSL